MDTEVRKLPRKTVIIIIILIILGILSFFLVKLGKATKATDILKTLGFENVSEVMVYGTQEFIREDVNIKGKKYNVSFIDTTTNQRCKGFILKDYKGNVDKDLTCKKGQ